MNQWTYFLYLYLCLSSIHIEYTHVIITPCSGEEPRSNFSLPMRDIVKKLSHFVIPNFVRNRFFLTCMKKKLPCLIRWVQKGSLRDDKTENGNTTEGKVRDWIKKREKDVYIKIVHKKTKTISCEANMILKREQVL